MHGGCTKENLKLGLQLRTHDLLDIHRGLVEEESHALTSQALADDVELDALLVDHVGDTASN